MMITLSHFSNMVFIS